MAPSRRCEVLVVGAGPAGIAAACCAAEDGARVAVIDDNPAAGGQIWRGAAADNDGAVREVAGSRNEPAAAWLDRAEKAGVEFVTQMTVIGTPQAGRVTTERDGAPHEIEYERLILATGARERWLPFPGWTLPGVAGAGGLQALAKGGLEIEGKRFVVAGSGPLLLAVAAYLRRRGGDVRLVAEQASRGNVMRFGLSLAARPAKLREAVRLRRELAGIPYRLGCWPVGAVGVDQLEGVTLRDARRTWTEPCDYLACGFGLVPNVELAALVGCAIERGAVRTDSYQATSVADVYAAGELTGIGGLELSLVEGEIAGHAAAGRRDAAERLFRRRESAVRFAGALERGFTLRDELRGLATPETIVCRCEDVTLARLERFAGWRDAKLQTRCGMGPCQGRVCGPIVEFLFGWQPGSVRPPVFPTSVECLTTPRTPDRSE